MHNRLKLDNLGGVYAFQETLDFLQKAYALALDAMAAGLGNKWILSGCVDSGTAVTDGWIVLDGELLPFTGAAMPGGTPRVKITEVVTQEQYDDIVDKDFYYRKSAALVNLGDFDYSELKRLPNNSGIMQAVTDMHTIISKIVNIEDGVILDGCIESAIDTGAQTLVISAGNALLGGKLVVAPAYTGNYPAFLTTDGTWVTSTPAAPYVRFWPHTSQRYADVLRRATTPAGEIKMFETLSDRFDAVTGVGKYEMLGFSLVAALQSRVPLGLRWDGIAETNVSDANYDTAGNQGGEKEHVLIEAELAAHKHQVGTHSTSRGPGGGGREVFDAPDDDNFWTTETGGDQGHNNVQPYTVVVYAKRTA